MKYIAVLFLLLSLNTCSNDTEDLASELLGDWEWISSSGGIAGQVLTPESTGETRSLSITATLFRQYTNAVLINESPYELIRDTSLLFGDKRDLIVHDNDFRDIYEVQNDTLRLTGDCFDCFQSLYARK